MQKYSEYQPTGFDSKGLNLDDQQNWLVVPVGQNRDSGDLDLSNFQTALDMLGDESETVEVHRFNHWACGWLEIIIVQPDSEAQAKAQEIEDSLESYSILDETDYSKREYESAIEIIQTCGADDTQSGDVFSWLGDNGIDYHPESICEKDVREALIALEYKAECACCGEFEDTSEIVSESGVCADMCKVCVTDYLEKFENSILVALQDTGLDYRTRNVLENALGKAQLIETLPNLVA